MRSRASATGRFHPFVRGQINDARDDATAQAAHKMAERVVSRKHQPQQTEIIGLDKMTCKESRKNQAARQAGYGVGWRGKAPAVRAAEKERPLGRMAGNQCGIAIV